MKLGFFTMPIHPIGKDWRQTLREDKEAFILADQLGYSEAYTGEHSTGHRHHQHAQPSSRGNRRHHRHARPPAGRAPDLRDQRGRTAL